MKKFFFLLAFATCAFVASGQTGSWYIGGVVGITSSASESAAGNTTTSTYWAFAPEAGAFIKALKRMPKTTFRQAEVAASAKIVRRRKESFAGGKLV